jgi:hypothetical protein
MREGCAVASDKVPCSGGPRRRLVECVVELDCGVLAFTNAPCEEPHRSRPGWCRRPWEPAKLGLLGLLGRWLRQKQRRKRPSIELRELLGLAEGQEVVAVLHHLKLGPAQIDRARRVLDRIARGFPCPQQNLRRDVCQRSGCHRIDPTALLRRRSRATYAVHSDRSRVARRSCQLG